MRDLALPASITLLAGAVFLHALTPAHADIPPYPAPEPAAPTPAVVLPPLPPECAPIRLGTSREYEKVMAELLASGRTQVVMVGTGLVCAWR